MERSKPFRHARRQHEKETAEDYTELVYDLIEEFGEARISKLSERLGISHVTALRSVARLQEQGFLLKDIKGPVELSAKGRKLAVFCKHRHQLLLDFFEKLGVSRAVAEIDVEGAEHHISDETLSCIEAFLKGPAG